MNCAILALLFAASPLHSQALPVPDVHDEMAKKIADPELSSLTREILRKKNRDYEKVAKDKLKTDGERFDHARVEVTGVASSDNTYKFNQTDFDRQIKPSFTVAEEGLMAAVSRKINSAFRALIPAVDLNGIPRTSIEVMHDSVEFEQAAGGMVTARAKKVLAPYRDKEINELVAHSWGTELVYAAILNGELRPPKKLIVVGVPDNNYQKWEMLAARTGTEIHWVRSPNDTIAAGGAAVADKNRWVNYEAKWAALCSNPQTKESCGAHNRKSASVVWVDIGDNPGTAGHDRVAYYELLKKKKVLKGTVLDLRRAESERLTVETLRVKTMALEAAEQEARGLIAQAREQAKIARRDHDARLRVSWIDIARRSCSDPGSVTQAELSALPDPYQKDFQQSTAYQNGLDSCGILVYIQLSNRMDAERLRQISTPVVAVPIQRPPPVIQPAPPGPQPAVSAFPFSSSFQRLRNLAVTACNSRGSVAVDRDLIHPRQPFSFDRGLEDLAEASLSSGLGECQRRLFQKLIETIRSEQGTDINELWVRDWAAVYSRSPDTPSFDYSPPKGCIPGDNSRRNCIACGNSRCD